jgi:hypothetical protein
MSYRLGWSDGLRNETPFFEKETGFLFLEARAKKFY